ncbi:MAG: hypothetical protein HY332_14475 [Chloroflexi bacterium]|nr:hypothetical protein [Chloroflexota bacterium]
MADLPAYRDSNGETGDDAGVGSDRGSTTSAPAYPGAPRWVKVSGIVVLVLVLLVVIVIVAGGGQHGPRRHMPSGAPGGHTPPAAQAVQPA